MASDDQTLKQSVSWAVNMQPDASAKEIYKICHASPELGHMSREAVMNAIHEAMGTKDINSINHRGKIMGKKKEEASATLTTEREDYQYGPYRIIAAFMNGGYHAYAYAGSKVVIKLSGEDADAVTREMHEAVDAHVQELQKNRSPEGVPSANEYREAMEMLPGKMPKRLFSHLKSRLKRHGNKIVIGDMMRDMEHDTPQATENSFALLGRQLIKQLNFEPSSNALPDKLKPFHVLANPLKKRNDGTIIWELRPEVVKALTENS